MIESRDSLKFVTGVLNEVSRYPDFRLPELREKVKHQRKVFKRSIELFNDTHFMPCGYQDAAGDRAEHEGRQLMTLIHAYLTVKYQEFPKRLKLMIKTDLIGEVNE